MLYGDKDVSHLRGMHNWVIVCIGIGGTILFGVGFALPVLNAPDILKTDSICLDGEGKRMYISGFKTFYIDKKGKNYIHRYSCTLPFSYWKELQKNKSPYTINICSGKDRIQYGYTTKAWNKERRWMLQIIYLIERNGAIRTYNTSTIK